MIAIVNVGPADKGRTKYEVRINQEVITTFEHHRGKGLVVCLQHAANAVETHDMLKFFDEMDRITEVAIEREQA